MAALLENLKEVEAVMDEAFEGAILIASMKVNELVLVTAAINNLAEKNVKSESAS